MADYTPQQIEEMRAAVQQADRLAAEQRVAEENAYLLALRNYTNSAAYAEVTAAIVAIKATYRDDERFAPFIENLMLGLPTLKERAGPLPAPVTEDDSDG